MLCSSCSDCRFFNGILFKGPMIIFMFSMYILTLYFDWKTVTTNEILGGLFGWTSICNFKITHLFPRT